MNLSGKISDGEKVTIGFYNLENLFDIQNHPDNLDDDFTPGGFKRWTAGRYKNKLFKLSKTISQLDKSGATPGPVILGMAEVENYGVIEDLLDTKWLSPGKYGYVHHDSPDERGIDTGLIYQTEYFKPEEHSPLPLIIYEKDGTRDRTRDILYVRGKLNGEPVHIFVNHWPSRRDGDLDTEFKRIAAANAILDAMERIERTEERPNYIIMGDFNDDPYSRSIKHLVTQKALYNPMEKLLMPTRGSARYQKIWSLFDQIILSHSFLNFEKETHSFVKADIYDPKFLKEWSLPFKGRPFRTFAGKKYLGGASDHFPVFVELKYHA